MRKLLPFTAALLVALCAPSSASADAWSPILPPADAVAWAKLSGYAQAAVATAASGDVYSVSTESEYQSGDASWHQYLDLAKIDAGSDEINLVDRVDLGVLGTATPVENAPTIAPYGSGVCVATAENQYGGYADPRRIVLRCTSSGDELEEMGTATNPYGFSSAPEQWVTDPALINFQGTLYASWFEGASSSTIRVGRWTGTTWQILQSVPSGFFGYSGRESALTNVGGRLLLTWHTTGATDFLRTRAVDPQNGQLSAFAQDYQDEAAADDFPMRIQSSAALGDNLALALLSTDQQTYVDEGESIVVSNESGAWSRAGEQYGPFLGDVPAENVKLAESQGRLIVFFSSPFAWYDTYPTDIKFGSDLYAAVWRPNAGQWTPLPADGMPLNFDGWFGAAPLGLTLSGDRVVAVWNEHPESYSDPDPVLGSAFPLADVPADVPKPQKLIPPPPAPAKLPATFARPNLSVVRGKRSIVVSTTARLSATGLNAATCKGKVSAHLSSKGKSIAAKKFALKFKKGRCVAAVKLSVKKRYRKRKVTLRLELVGSNTASAAPLATSFKL